MITLKDPHWFCEWITANEENQERISFLMDVIFTMRRQFSDLELVISLDPTDDDVIIVEPLGIEPYRFRLSDYRAIEGTLLSYKISQSYRDFIQVYSQWRKRYQEWWRSYRNCIAFFERFVLED